MFDRENKVKETNILSESVQVCPVQSIGKTSLSTIVVVTK